MAAFSTGVENPARISWSDRAIIPIHQAFSIDLVYERVDDIAFSVKVKKALLKVI